ncbi:hypothetical protein PVAND_013727 [Polypedilum vanderplanki]|uniref:Constitutive coactivator of peroxisome proliferator-activated receptor gamma n=1 Tax=Polypedilum vanderplanki TaxID=319348 RepID=A0A9J6CQK9_POLVA|nr:hypothetical protein PVAND_013727 [Polypedilum vanderplanki]
MGVRQLQTYIQNYVPNGYIDISLIDECKKYFRINNVRPIIVIDLMGLVSMVNNEYEILCGGRFNHYKDFYENLFKKISLYAELVFFEDGPVCSQKMKTWFKRQNEGYEKCLRILEDVYQQYPLKLIPSRHRDIPPIFTHLSIIEFLSKKYGTLILTITKECDAEIARYACLNPRVIAVLADDSDFLIFTGNWKYLSIKQLDHNTLITKEYNRRALREHLQLNDTQLVILSSLNGNDVIQYEDTLIFHKSLIGNEKFKNCSVRFPALAKFINHCLPENFDELLPALAKTIFQNTNAVYLKKIEESLNFYNTNFTPIEPSDPLLKLCRDKTFDFVYAVLKRMPDTFILSYYDLRLDDFPNLFKKTMKLLCSQVGIILKSIGRYWNYEVTTKKSHEIGYNKYYVEPIIPDQRIPNVPLHELLQRDKFPQHDKLRFNLLKWTISTKERFYNINIQQIPINYLKDVLLLTFLVTEEFISVKEADIILLSIKYVEENDFPFGVQQLPEYLDRRGFRIAFLFGKFHSYVEKSFEVTGLQDLCKLINFDGVLFNNLYLHYAYTTSFNARQLLGDVAKYRIYR